MPGLSLFAVRDVVSEPVVLTAWHGHVLLVTLNRPSVSNGLDVELLEAFSNVWVDAASTQCRAVVLTGAGRNFCGGADLSARRANVGAAELRNIFHPPYLAMASCQKPIIAAVNGAAAGGGLGLALAADLRIAAENARFVPGWVQIGLVPDLGASWFAPRVIGEARAFAWFASGRQLLAAEALAIGLVNEVVPAGGLIEAALQRAQTLADQPGDAVVLTKRLLAASRANGLADQLEAEIRFQDIALAAPTRAEQVAARMARFAKPKAAPFT
jgi:2-(1,2-epoxy-1,2-dihydrophenyl)acetyl-CoA isomerase